MEDPKKWTQARIAVALGVGQDTISDWLDTSNSGSGKASIDARLSVTAEDKTIIIEQSAEGVTQKQIAADFGISQQRVSQIVTTATAKTVKRKQLDAIAVALGVSRATVENWFDTSNDKSVKASIDARLSVSAESKTTIIEQVAEGVTQKQLAADFGISVGGIMSSHNL